MKNGETTFGIRCALCGRLTASSSGQDPMKWIDGKAVCLVCYPRAVDVYLADVRLRESESDFQKPQEGSK